MKDITCILNINDEYIKKYPIGLAHGKMGICIFLFEYSKTISSNKSTNKAELLLDDITNNLSKIHEIDIEHGLSGIAIGLTYLTNNQFISGNSNKIFQEFNNILYQKLNQQKQGFSIDILIQVLYYFQTYLQNGDMNRENRFLYSNLCVSLLNNIHEIINIEYFLEPYTPSLMGYKLPFLLYTLSKSLTIQETSYKAERMLIEMSSEITSIIPQKNLNKIYLLFGLLSINNKRIHSLWHKYIDFIFHDIDIIKMLTKELKDQHIFFDNGAVGAYWLMKQINKLNTPYHFNIDKTMFDHKIYNSQAWNLMKNNPEYLQQHLGLMHGYTGILMAYK